MLASAKVDDAGKYDQDNVAINQSDISIQEEPDVPPEGGIQNFTKSQVANQHKYKDYSTSKNYIVEADPNQDLL